MQDREFLMWIHQRLENVHGEDHLLDYMHKLRCIIVDTHPNRMTPNDGRGGNNYKDLVKILESLSLVE